MVGKWNEEAAPNNNLTSKELRAAKQKNKKYEHEFSEELSDGGERNERFLKPRYM
ncbi:hypothetical protein KHA94_14540 [Bacillus sp. FJAT-49705]|uniref:Uncharacterized protein n=1 Tax=Cytobacillus citreus TaxID=2833586 RepID=A0ABS5NU93_9BACI|nr:hypothetical protein [Cytobacillus citreus]MBS4191405.1 hypothetical protein [Cytobacillus citreus]